MFSFENIYASYRECRKNKSNKISCIEFEFDLINNLWQLCYELQNKEYEIGRSICFLSHTPKLREVFAASFKDRIVHHILVRELEKMYERKFIYDVYNNREGKGTHRAVKRAKSFLKANSYYLQLDIRGFFYHLDKDILFNTIKEDILKFSQKNLLSSISINKEDILYLCKKIIYHDPTKDFIIKGDQKAIDSLPAHKSLFKTPALKGLAIGNLTSQFFANVYLNRFDHFVKRELKLKYIRYVDDFVLFSNSKSRLKEVKDLIENYLKDHLQLSLRDDFRLRGANDGLDFLGYIIRPWYLLVRRRVVNNFRQKRARFLANEFKNGLCSLESAKRFKQVNASYYGHFKHANSFKLMNKYYIKEWL
jgi:hypothetical protein